MDEPGSVVLVDNTTFAAAGRTLYRGHDATEGGRHAREYDALYPFARREEAHSLAELLSAFVLFDRVVWDASSCAQETAQMNDDDAYSCWLYDWFPLFDKARDLGILTSLDRGPGAATFGLERAERLAMEWVQHGVAAGRVVLPKYFRVPRIYSSDTYEDRERFEFLNREFDLCERDLALAMFLYRGLFYYSRTVGRSGWCYLPHSYRSLLLSRPEVAAHALFCENELFPAPREIGTEELFRQLGQRLAQAVHEHVQIEPLGARVALGGAFLQGHREPQDAVEAAFEFRFSSPGMELRESFHEMIGVGQESNKKGVEARLADLERQLAASARAHFGSARFDGAEELRLLELLGPVGKLLTPVLDWLPIPWRESLVRLLYSGTHRRGLQVLFAHYLHPARRGA